MIIKKLSVKNYRNIGNEWVDFDFDRINILVGKNNVGKTGILDLISKLSRINLITNNFEPNTFRIEDVNNYEHENKNIEIKLRLKIEEEYLERRQIAASDYWYVHIKIIDNFNAYELIEDSVTIASKDKINELFYSRINDDPLYKKDRVRDWLNSEQPLKPIKTEAIDIASRLTISQDMRQRLYSLVNPEPTHRRQAQATRDALLAPVIELLGKRVTLTVHSANDVPAFIIGDPEDDVAIKFSDLASGIQSLFIMFEKILQNQNAVICIDEPEAHLHPSLQRVFLKYISNISDGNQFFLATHSSVMLDYETNKKIVSLNFTENRFVAEQAYEDRALRAVVADLGFRPSDIVQANGVIWVEGPSDRIYINRWIELLDNKKIEGLHYTFQFYGGSLLGRLSVEDRDEELDDTKLSILRLNPNYFFVMDSDASDEYELTNLWPRQQSMIKKLKEKHQELPPYWVTAGRTIENYLPKNVLKTSKFQDPTEVSSSLKNDKIKFAMDVKDQILLDNMDNYGLIEQVKLLLSHINKWNNN